MKIIGSRWAIALAAGMLANAASAALPTGILEFVQPDATVGAHDQIDVLVRVTIDPASAPLIFSSDPLSGFAAADLPTQGNFRDPATGSTALRDFAQYTGAYLNTYFSCNDTFTGGCNNNTTNYSYSFFTSSQPGKPSVNFLSSFNLGAGESYEYVFSQFHPAASGAAAGVYRFFGTGLTLNIQGTDADGNSLEWGYTIASTEGGTPFTRTVTAVPEPASYLMLAMGLLAVGCSARRRVRG